MSNSVRPHRQQPTRLPRPLDSPGKNTGVGCHFLLQCMKVKSESESEVAQSCLDSSRPHGLQPIRLLLPWDFPGKSTGVCCHCLLWCMLLIFLFVLNFKVSPLPCHAVGPYSCKRACGRTLTCQNHTCMKECHKVTETDSCTDKKKVMSLD